jgi:hypothetical protein
VTSPDEIALATVELLGALTYGQLRSFQVTASAIRVAPDARSADRLADFAVREHRAYELLREHLRNRTDLPAAVMDRQKPVFDAYFDGVQLDTWRSANAFFALGLPLAADFIRQIAPALSPETALVVVGALADRGPFESFALQALLGEMTDDESRAEARHLIADVLGRALTGFQGAIADTDALQVLLRAGQGGQDTGDDLVRATAMAVLEGHRRRMHTLGLEEVD